MIYSEFQGMNLSMLGFGTMRLPQNEDGSINEQQTFEMVDYAMAHGVNYFDTAYPYHDGNSERVLGRALARYPRDSYYIATKYPGHQITDHYDPKAVFEDQLNKCGVDHFDFYLLHNIYENSIGVYKDPKWGILDYFLEQKRLGRIRHLGFSCHGSTKILMEFLDYCGEHMEFCQLQVNYVDWTLQDARTKCALCGMRDIPVWVMEPVRGGRLADLTPEQTRKLKKARPNEKPVAWSFRFLQGIPQVKVILSGMSSPQQMQANIATFEEKKPLSPREKELILSIAEEMKDSVPCTSCRYCCGGCPVQLDIPRLLAVYNDMRITPLTTVAMRLDDLPPEKMPSACIGCGKCTRTCPQGIPVAEHLKDFSAMLAKVPTWAQVCKERDEAQKRNKK